MSTYRAHIFKQRNVGFREEVKIKFFDANGDPLDLGGPSQAEVYVLGTDITIANEGYDPDDAAFILTGNVVHMRGRLSANQSNGTTMLEEVPEELWPLELVRIPVYISIYDGAQKYKHGRILVWPNGFANAEILDDSEAWTGLDETAEINLSGSYVAGA